MNSLLYYYNNVQKMAAYRQAKRMQRGVKLGYGESPSVSSSTKFTMPPVTIGLSDYSIEYFGNSIGSIGSNPAYMKTSVGVRESGGILAWGYEDGSNGVNIIRFGNTSDGASNQVYPNVKFDNDDPFHLVITRQGNEIKIYVNNELAITWDTREVLDMGDMDLIFANSSDVGFVRVWNYALSADDVTAHYNNGDPMGYVVPKAMRRPEIAFPSGIYTESSRTFTQNNTQSTTATYNNPQANGFSGSYMRFDAVTTVSLYNAFWSSILKRAYPIKVTMEYRCNYDLYEGNTVQASGRMLATANDGDAKVVAIYPNSLGNANLGIGSNNAPDAWLEIRVTSIESVGLLAEYLPQNLMEYPNAGDLDVLSTNSYTWTGPDDSNYGISIPLSGYITAKKCVVTIEVSNYEAGAPFFKISTSNSTSIPQQNGTFELEQIILGDAYNRVAIYGGNVGTDRRMTITVKGIRQINGISYSWLDSAKQLPLSDEYIEPLFQSIGGYDMTANGVPEIIYNE